MKRFYTSATVAETPGGFRVQLDTRIIKTAGGKPQVLPYRLLTQALADEWAQQGSEINPALFRFRDLADYAIDIIAPDRTTAIDKLLAFAETDTLCYRADPEQPLYRRQQDIWEPILTAFEAREAVRLERVCGVIHRPQSSKSIAKLRLGLENLGDFALAGLTALASLSASLAIGLTALEPDADREPLWQAANLEELWQAGLWGMDAEAQARLNKRHGDFMTAWDFVRLLRY